MLALRAAEVIVALPQQSVESMLAVHYRKCLLSCLPLISFRSRTFQQEVGAIANWYNACRPHTWLGGRTPDEVYYGRYPANRKPRLEPRDRWPRGSPCARPWALVRGKAGARLELEVTFDAGRKHLPIVTISRAA